MICRRPLFLGFILCNLLSVCVSVAWADALPRGDYDGDGIQDLGVASVVEDSGSLAKTEVTIRSSRNGKKISYALSLKTDAFVNGRYFENQPTGVAAIFAISPKDPLLWSFVRPSDKQVLQLRYGLVGDLIANAIDFDGDEIDDIFVIRPGVKNEMGDSKRYLHWYIHGSVLNGDAVDYVFGIKGDKVFTFDYKGKPFLASVRIETQGTCAGQLAWYTSSFETDISKRVVTQTCWGLARDIPLTPIEIDGKLKLVVVRPSGDLQIAYIRDADSSSYESRVLGLSNSIPGFANLYSQEGNFFWVQRSTPGFGDVSYVGVRRADQSDSVLKFGTAKSIILRPDGTYVYPTDSGRLTANNTTGIQIQEVLPSGGGTDNTNKNTGNNSNGECSKIVSISRLSGVLYKSENVHGGRGPTFIVQNPSQRTGKRSLQIRNMNCDVIAAFGLFATDYPYGARYYMRVPGGSRQGPSELLALARRAGKTDILVEGVNGTWIQIRNPLNREGNVRS